MVWIVFVMLGLMLIELLLVLVRLGFGVMVGNCVLDFWVLFIDGLIFMWEMLCVGGVEII